MATRRNKSRTPRQTLPFCTTCGDVLEDYCFSEQSKNVKDVIKNLGKCKAEGRFKGRFCAKLFIAGTDGTYRPSKKVRVSKKKLDQLKKSIVTEISKEAAQKTTGR